jgi:hypothetical protein
VLLLTIGMTAGAAMLTPGFALASGSGSEPGNLVLKPASGAITLTPTWSTTDGCPAGHQASAVMAMFTTGGRMLSRISVTVSHVSSAFSGILDGNIGAILRFANVRNGGSVKWAVGCWSLEAGTGSVEYVQSTLVTLSSDGKSYTTSASSGQQGSTAGQAGAGSAANNAGGTAANAANAARGSVARAGGGGMGAPPLAGLIAAACALAAGIAGFVWHRRRNRSRLM